MNNFNRGGMQNFTFSEVTSKVEARPLLRLVYLWMMFGLLTTAAVSWYVATNMAVLRAVSGLILPIDSGSGVIPGVIGVGIGAALHAASSRVIFAIIVKILFIAISIFQLMRFLRAYHCHAKNEGWQDGTCNTD